MQAAPETMTDIKAASAGACNVRAVNSVLDSGAGFAGACVKALRSAALYGHWDLYKRLLDRSQGQLRSALAGEALVISAGMGDAATVASLLKNDANDSDRMNEALGKAVTNGHPKVVKLLLDYCATRMQAIREEPLLSCDNATLTMVDPTINPARGAGEVPVVRLPADEDTASQYYRSASTTV